MTLQKSLPTATTRSIVGNNIEWRSL